MSSRDGRARRGRHDGHNNSSGGLLRRGGHSRGGAAAAHGDVAARTPTAHTRPQATATDADNDDALVSVSPMVAAAAATTTAAAAAADAAAAVTLSSTAATSFALFDDDASFAVRATSPLPSQLSQWQPPASQDVDGATPAAATSVSDGNNNNNSNNMTSALRSLPRQRPRFHTVQDLDVALNQAIEGKINSKNAWASKEASDLLEGIAHTIAHTLAAHSADDYSGFAKAATVVEGCSKVWTVRVDSTYQQSSRMVQRLLRNDDNEDGGGGRGRRGGAGGGGEGETTAEEGDDVDGDGGDAEEDEEERRRRRRARAHPRRPLARTIAFEATEIDLDARARAALMQSGGVRAQFRAVTERFDQGNAQGLLTHNAPLGVGGNLVLDVDYARAASCLPRCNSSSDNNVGSSEADEATAQPPRAAAAAAATQTSCCVLDAYDVAPRAEFVTTLPPYDLTAMLQQCAQCEQQQQQQQREQHTTTTRRSDGARTGSEAAATSRTSLDATAASLATLLMLTTPVTTAKPPLPPRHSNDMTSTAAAAAYADGGSSHSGDEDRRTALVTATAAATAANTHVDAVSNDDDDMEAADGGEDDMGGDDGGGDDMAWGACDDAEQWPHDRDAQRNSRTRMHGSSSNNDDDDEEDSVNVQRRSDAARALVSGAAELNAMDALLATSTQLALAADDPALWCPLAAVSPHATALTDAAPRSELTRLHRQHHLAAGAHEDAATRAGGGGDDVSRKRARKAHTVVFVLPTDDDEDKDDRTTTTARDKRRRLYDNNDDDNDAQQSAKRAAYALGPLSQDDSNNNNSSSSTRCRSRLAACGALKQSTSAGAHMTPLGKALLLARDAAQVLLTYTQGGAVQRARAEQAGLLLAPAPVPGVSIPRYMPWPVTMMSFFAPFATTRPGWSLLCKAASGGQLHTRNRHSVGRVGGGVSGVAAAAAAGEDAVRRRGAASGTDERHSREGSAEMEMPIEYIPTGAAALANAYGAHHHDDDHHDHGDSANNDDDGDNVYDADYGGGDADDGMGDGYDDVVTRANQQLLEQFNLLHSEAAEQHGGSGNGNSGSNSGSNSDGGGVAAVRPSARVSGAEVAAAVSATRDGAARASLSPDEYASLLHVLHGADVTMASQIDVVGLRDVMWRVLQQLLCLSDTQNNNSDKSSSHRSVATAAAATGAATVEQSRDAPHVAPSSASSSWPHGSRHGGGAAASMLKPHVSAALARVRAQTTQPTTTTTTTTTENSTVGAKRSRADTSSDDDDDDNDEKAKKVDNTTTTTTNNNNNNATTTTTTTSAATATRPTVTRFSDVVHATLPFVASVSSTGTLSPAFFFFCILFMANEHSLQLDSVASLDDLVVRGIATTTTAAAAATS